MRHIFIDTNIYLEFYVQQKQAYRELLAALPLLKEEIFVSQQIVDEVQRNKLSVFLQHANNFYAQIPQKLNLPSLIHGDEDATAWNKKAEAIKSDLAGIAKSYQQRITKLATSISRSTDGVSKELQKVFAEAQAASDEHLTRARTRPCFPTIATHE